MKDFLSFTAVRKDKDTEPDMPLYSGSRSNVFVVLPVGIYDIKAKIHEEAGTYAEAYASTDFKSYIPTESEYWGYDKQADLKYHGEVGDSDRVSQINIADVSCTLTRRKVKFEITIIFLIQASIERDACYLNPACKLKVSNEDLLDVKNSNMTDTQIAEFTELQITLAQVRSEI